MKIGAARISKRQTSSSSPNFFPEPSSRARAVRLAACPLVAPRRRRRRSKPPAGRPPFTVPPPRAAVSSSTPLAAPCPKPIAAALRPCRPKAFLSLCCARCCPATAAPPPLPRRRLISPPLSSRSPAPELAEVAVAKPTGSPLPLPRQARCPSIAVRLAGAAVLPPPCRTHAASAQSLSSRPSTEPIPCCSIVPCRAKSRVARAPLPCHCRSCPSPDVTAIPVPNPSPRAAPSPEPAEAARAISPVSIALIFSGTVWTVPCRLAGAAVSPVPCHAKLESLSRAELLSVPPSPEPCRLAPHPCRHCSSSEHRLTTSTVAVRHHTERRHGDAERSSNGHEFSIRGRRGKKHGEDTEATWKKFVSKMGSAERRRWDGFSCETDGTTYQTRLGKL